MTIKELIELLETAEDQTQEIDLLIEASDGEIYVNHITELKPPSPRFGIYYLA